MTPISFQQLDQLALHGCEVLGSFGGQAGEYDVAGYDRVLRREVLPAEIRVRDCPESPAIPRPGEARFDSQPVRVRLTGFRRRRLFGPDEIGARFRRGCLPWSDSLGNGLYESLLIDRKYGLSHVLEAPMLGFDLPFLDGGLAEFERCYRQAVSRLVDRLGELEPVYGAGLVHREAGWIVLACLHTPLSFFARAYERNPQAVLEALEKEMGVLGVGGLPPDQPANPRERLALARFWAWLRARHGRVLALQARVLRDFFPAQTRLAGSFHELPALDFTAQGQIYDDPGVAVRPLLLEDDLLLRHYTAYFTQLTGDLTGRPPSVSLRINLAAAGSRFVPTGNLIRRWYTQAVQHGAGSFYFFPHDYPMHPSSPYNGPMIGNPEASTFPRERWETSLEILGSLAGRRRFNPPPAQVAILTPGRAAFLRRQEWRAIYALFSACAEARVHCRFVGDWQIARAGAPAEVRLLLAPALEFLSPGLRLGLQAFLDRGGRLWMPSQPLYDEQARPLPHFTGAEDLPEEITGCFPLEHPANPGDLDAAAGWVRRLVEACQVEPYAWLFDLAIEHLPPAEAWGLRPPQPEIEFSHSLYEQGSDWIYPYLKR